MAVPLSAPHLTGPPQFQTLCESSRLYEPGSQYTEFVKRLLPASRSQRDVPSSTAAAAGAAGPFTFEPYGADETARERRTNGQLMLDGAARVTGQVARGV